MERYYYIHSICFWEGAPRTNNLIEHAKKIKTIDLSEKSEDKNLLIICYSVDSNIDFVDLSRFDELMKEASPTLDILIVPRKNTGGTLGAMWDIWKNILEDKISSKYFGQWEDDYIFNDQNFLEEVQKFFDQGNVFVGSIWQEDLFDMNEVIKNGYKSFFPTDKLIGIMNSFVDPKWSIEDERLPEYRWCEDPYIMPFENLKIIENTIGRFTLAPSEESYSHFRHGIFFGEVGFPSRLHLSGLNFTGVRQEDLIYWLNQTTGDRNP